MNSGRVLNYGILIAAVGAAIGIADPSALRPISPDLASQAQAIKTRIVGQISRAPSPEKALSLKSGIATAGSSLPPTNVLVAKAVKGALPLIVDTVGTVQPMASVALRTHIDVQIANVLVTDGAKVKAGDVLVQFDARQIQAQIEQADANLTKDHAQEGQAKRDLQRGIDLLARGAGTKLAVDTARTNEAGLQASIAADQAALDNLKVQLGWYTISAPISGRIGVFSAKQGNIIRAADSNATGVLTTINQVSPIYVALSLPQSQLPQLREAMNTSGATVIATPQGNKTSVEGKISVIDNAIDPATGTIMVRATFDNADEILWPGQLCDVKVTLSVAPNAVTIPREAVQNGQNGNYVFILNNNIARLQPITVERTQGELAVISSGLDGTETIVRDGAMRLINGSKVIIRNPNVLSQAMDMKAN